MKKILSILMSVLMLTTLFASCAKDPDFVDETTLHLTETKAPESEAEITLSKDPVRIFTLKGPTGMGMAPLMENSANGDAELNYTFTLENAADAFVGNIVKGDFEIACVPTNLASVLYKKTEGNIQVAAVNTLGVLYILENGEEIKDIKDLEGKTIYSSGQGAVPEYALNYILEAFGINCEIIFESEHDLVVSDLITEKATVALLPEPKVTAALKNENAPEKLRVALDLTELWDEACEKKGEEGSLYMGCIIINKKWAEENKNELSAFLSEYKESVDTVNNDIDTASELIAKHGIIPKAPLAKAAIPGANIVFITGEKMEKGMTGFLKVLYSFNPSSVGGEIPSEDFYYNKK